MHLVLLLQPPEDRQRLGHGRLAHEDRLESALQRGVLLDVPAVFVQRGRAHHPKLAASQRRLEHVARVDGAFRGPRPDDRMQLVEEDDVSPAALGDLLQGALQSLLELAAELGAREHRSDVELNQLLVSEGLRDIRLHDPLGQALRDRRLPDPGLTDQHGVVLGPARQHLHHTTDFLVTADHRIQLAVPGPLGQVYAEPLQRPVLLLRLGIRDPVRTPDVGQRRGQEVRSRPGTGQDPGRAGCLGTG